MTEPDVDVLIVGGGPAGATLGSLLAADGWRAMVVERDVHPRDHVGESLTPSTNQVFNRIGFLPRMEDAGFVHKPGACWTAPSASPGSFFSLRLAEFPMPEAVQTYTYNVERDLFDTLLLRHAHEGGAHVLQGVSAREVLFEDGRAVGARLRVADGWERDVRARVVVDASGRRCMLASQLGLRRKDPRFNQYAIYSWFRGVAPLPPGYEGFLFLHFLGLERAWGWQIPLRDETWSIGVVTERNDFQKSGRTHEEFFDGLVGRSRSFARAMEGAERVRPWWIEGDYSYIVDRIQGPGWLMIGDALRFVDPIFSSGVDVAVYSAEFAAAAIGDVLRGEAEGPAFAQFERRVSTGVDVWYELTDLFYGLQNLFTRYAVARRFREDVIRILQGNPYLEDTQTRARRMIEMMRRSSERIQSDPSNLLRPGALAAPR